jgi:hypothetical protein
MIMPNKPWEEILILLQMTIKFQGTWLSLTHHGRIELKAQFKS